MTDLVAHNPDGRPCALCGDAQQPRYVDYRAHPICYGCFNDLQLPCRDNGQRPFIQIDPQIRGGEPCLGHTRLEAGLVAWSAEHNGGVADTADNYGVTRAEVRLAVWFARAYQLRRRGGSAGYFAALRDYDAAVAAAREPPWGDGAVYVVEDSAR